MVGGLWVWGQAGIRVVAVRHEVKEKKPTYPWPKSGLVCSGALSCLLLTKAVLTIYQQHGKHGLQKEWGTFILSFYGNLKEEETVSEWHTKPQSDTINYAHRLLSTFTVGHGAAFSTSQVPGKGLRSGHHILAYALFWVWGMNGSWRRSRK